MEKTTRGKSRKINTIGNKEIDLMAMFKAIWKKFWLVVLVTVVAGVLTYVGCKVFVAPTYRSSFTAYVNNNKEVDLSSRTSSDVMASKALAHTYSELITSRSVLVGAAEKADIDMGYDKLRKMVKTSIGSETEIISVSVDAKSPSVAYELATAISSEALPVTGEIVEGSSMKIIDVPEMPKGIYQPNYLKLGIFGAMFAFAIVVLIICFRQYFNDKVQSETELSEHYNIPIMGTIPDMNVAEKGSSDYYYSYGGSSGEKAEPEEEDESKKGGRKS